MFPWSQRKDTNYYLKKAAQNVGKAVDKELYFLSTSFCRKKRASFIDGFGAFVDESSAIISKDWKSLTGGHKEQSGSFGALSSSHPIGDPSQDNSNFFFCGLVGSVFAFGLALAFRESKRIELTGVFLVGVGVVAAYAAIPENDDNGNGYRPR